MYASRSTTRRRSRRDSDSDDDDKDVDGIDDECIMMHPYVATWPPLGSTRARDTRGPSGILKRAGKSGTHTDDTP